MQGNSYHLLSSILRPWYISEEAANSYFPVAEALLAGKPLPLLPGADQAKALLVMAVPGINLVNPEVTAFSEAAPGSVALLPVVGALMRYDNCGDPGMATMGKWIEEAEENPNIKGIVLYVNSGGGTVDYTDVLAGIIRNATKPVVTFTDGTMASAAYWLGSSADYVVLGSDNTMLGSIGTMWGLRSYQDPNVKIHNVRATKSVDKNESMYQAQQGNYELLRQELLDPMNENFLAAVEANRAGKIDPEKENVLTGKVYVGATAITAGLADERGTLATAVNKVLELAETKSSQYNPLNISGNMKKTILAGWSGLIAFLGLSIADGAASVEADITDEQLESLNAKLGELETVTASRDQLQGNADALATALAAAGVATLEALVADRDAWKTKAETYGSQPGATHTEPVKVGSDKIEEAAPKVVLDEEAQLYANFGKEINS